tara:strand:- start:38 stop:466 length:429 start_codon:yes stop_codon:yes gene_type:complete
MQVKTKVTYNAAKLVRALPKMIENFIQSSGNDSANESRKSIDEQRHGKKLSQLTIKSRLEGNHPSGKKIKTTDITPLKWSGNLYKNIKGTKKGLEMPRYGYYHHIGRTTGKIKRPERPFIEVKIGEKAEEQFKSDLIKNFRK